MNEIVSFTNEQFGSLRTVLIDDAPWFVGKDVAEKLGYTNSRKALNDHVEAEDKGVTFCDTPGGKQKMTVINESGLYSLILSSKLPSARQFKHWVTSEVLPSIRSKGLYSSPESVSRFLADPDAMIAVLQQITRERDANIQTQKKLAETTMKLSDVTSELSNAKQTIQEYSNRQVIASFDDPHESPYTITELAKFLSTPQFPVSRNYLYSVLRKRGLIRPDSCLPTLEAINRSLFVIAVRRRGKHTYYSTGVTPLGWLFFDANAKDIHDDHFLPDFPIDAPPDNSIPDWVLDIGYKRH